MRRIGQTCVNFNAKWLIIVQILSDYVEFYVIFYPYWRCVVLLLYPQLIKTIVKVPISDFIQNQSINNYISSN